MKISGALKKRLSFLFLMVLKKWTGLECIKMLFRWLGFIIDNFFVNLSETNAENPWHHRVSQKCIGFLSEKSSWIEKEKSFTQNNSTAFANG